MDTRSTPEFELDVQKDLWAIRREHAMFAGFPFIDEFEEMAIQALSAEGATDAVAEAREKLAEFKKDKEANRKRKGKAKDAGPSKEADGAPGEGTSGGGTSGDGNSGDGNSGGGNTGDGESHSADGDAGIK
jgi:hypothetical protein